MDEKHVLHPENIKVELAGEVAKKLPMPAQSLWKKVEAERREGGNQSAVSYVESVLKEQLEHTRRALEEIRTMAKQV